MEDDTVSKKADANFGLPKNLEGFSEEMLKDYKALLFAEIDQVDRAINDRDKLRAGAEALFKSK